MSRDIKGRPLDIFKQEKVEIGINVPQLCSDDKTLVGFSNTFVGLPRNCQFAGDVGSGGNVPLFHGTFTAAWH